MLQKVDSRQTIIRMTSSTHQQSAPTSTPLESSNLELSMKIDMMITLLLRLSGTVEQLRDDFASTKQDYAAMKAAVTDLSDLLLPVLHETQGTEQDASQLQHSVVEATASQQLAEFFHQFQGHDALKAEQEISTSKNSHPGPVQRSQTVPAFTCQSPSSSRPRLSRETSVASLPPMHVPFDFDIDDVRCPTPPFNPSSDLLTARQCLCNPNIEEELSHVQLLRLVRLLPNANPPLGERILAEERKKERKRMNHAGALRMLDPGAVLEVYDDETHTLMIVPSEKVHYTKGVEMYTNQLLAGNQDGKEICKQYKRSRVCKWWDRCKYIHLADGDGIESSIRTCPHFRISDHHTHHQDSDDKR